MESFRQTIGVIMYILLDNGETFEGTVEQFEDCFFGLNQVTDGSHDMKVAWIKAYADKQGMTFKLSPILSEVAQRYQRSLKNGKV